MASDYLKLFQKLDKPPACTNWVRFVDDNVASTTKNIIKFVRGQPTVTYVSGYAAIKDRINLGIPLDNALKLVRGSGNPDGRQSNEELVRAFFKHDEIRAYNPHNYVEFEREFFRVSRDIRVPVTPLSVIRDNGKFVPIFVCGWSKLQLTNFQRRLFMTICEDAFLSLTDFQNSPAEFLFFPKIHNGKTKTREAEVWGRADYDLLSDGQLKEAVEIYLKSREEVRLILLREMAENQSSNIKNKNSEVPRTPDLFD